MYDITPIVQDVATLGQRNVTVRVSLNLQRKVNKVTGQRRETRSTSSKVTSRHNALLVVFSQDKAFFKHFSELVKRQETLAALRAQYTNFQNSRQKRSSKKSLCEMQDLYVDFEKMGWGEWIVYPKRYNARMCAGRCPTPVAQHYEPTNHAVMQALARLVAPPGAVPRPCCAPTQLHPVSMLYYEYGEIVVRHHEDMIVGKCGCR